MKLFTEDIKRRLPPLYSTEHDSDPVVQVKLFAPWSQWTWFVTEFDGQNLLFGLVVGFEREWGYFSLSELEHARGPRGLRIERDLHFEPCRVSGLGLVGVP
jgi:hypothetical protein